MYASVYKLSDIVCVNGSVHVVNDNKRAPMNTLRIITKW